MCVACLRLAALFRENTRRAFYLLYTKKSVFEKKKCKNNCSPHTIIDHCANGGLQEERVYIYIYV